jgi:3-hydroxyacyl-CoA dehydrogenase / enoyl-CoA hydratase / 3-hydroxybutyryl-CoA epimerase
MVWVRRRSLSGSDAVMHTYFNLQFEGGVATISLEAPNADVNTVSPPWIEELISVFQYLKTDEKIKGIIVTSAKAGFMAGADLNFVIETASGMSLEQAFKFSQRATFLHRLIETCGKPVVAAMPGFALGGGYELALACTYRILADDPRALVGLPEVNVGLLPGSGGTQRLPRMIGVVKATEVLLEGKSYPPAEALALGLIDLIVPQNQVVAAARTWLFSNPVPIRPWDVKGFKIAESDGLLKQSTAGFFTLATAKLLARYGNNYPAPISILTCIFEGVQVPIDKGLLIESRHFAKLVTGSVARNIIRTTFINKGRAEKGAPRPAGLSASRVSNLGVLGAGMMGAGIAYVSAKVGIEVVLLDSTLERAAAAKAHSAKLLERQVKSGKLTETQAVAVMSRITPTANYVDLANADLVIEAVFEDTSIKAEVTRKAEAATGPGTLFASNTSTLPISKLADAFSRPQDFIGLHFFSPVDRMVLVEVIKGRQTSPQALARALDFVAQIRKTPIVVNDSRGFYTSRVFQTFIHEGMELLREGVTAALIENAARQAGMPVGPLAVTDEVSLELPMKIVRQAEMEDPQFRRPSSMQVLEKMVEELRRTGRKGGQGFYDYPGQGGRKTLWPGLEHTFARKSEQPGVDEVKKRLLYVQSLETARCFEEGVLGHAADGDLGAVLGWGFPSWTGGTLSLIDTLGVSQFVSECDRLSHLLGPRFAPSAQLREMAAHSRRFLT